jgi:AmiR/NasT family two-component response regulator
MRNPQDVRVLIAEDDYLIGEMIKGLLEEIGYTVVGGAVDGLEAVEMTQSLRPDVVLMDIKMPDTDGLEATRLIFERCPTPVVVLTAYETPELVEEASAAGAGAYLVKPPSAREMERAIIIAMARFDDLTELRRLNAELQDALAEVKTLSGLLPICSSCKKIRDDEGYWNQLETYIQEHSNVMFSHGLCPDCAKKLYPEIFGSDE